MVDRNPANLYRIRIKFRSVIIKIKKKVSKILLRTTLVQDETIISLPCDLLTLCI